MTYNCCYGSFLALTRSLTNAVFTPDTCRLDTSCIQLYPLSLSTLCLVSATKLLLTLHYGDCIHLYPDTIARLRYLYPATCTWCKRGLRAAQLNSQAHSNNIHHSALALRLTVSLSLCVCLCHSVRLSVCPSSPQLVNSSFQLNLTITSNLPLTGYNAYIP